MSSPVTLPAEIDRAVRTRLGDRGARFTPTRQVVVAQLSAAEGPLTPADLHRRLGARVPVSSLYRTLATLDDGGIVQRTHDAEGITRFELAEWLNGHHHHLVCVGCGEVRDLEIDGAWEHAVAALVGEMAAASGYIISGHRIDIEGKCARCAAI